LLLHGISVTWRSWKPVLPILERHHDVIAPTLLGHSGAAPLAEDVTPSVEALVDGVEAELDRLGLEAVHVAGNSLGGWVAIELARRGRARSVVAFSPAGAFESNLRLTTLAAGVRLGVDALELFGDRLERLALTPGGRRLLVSAMVAHPERFEPAEVLADVRAIRNAPILRPLMGVIGDHPMRPLPGSGCPIRLVWPRKDRILPFRHYGERTMKLLPRAELVRLDGVGHVPMVDDPDAVSRLILEVTGAVDAGAPVPAGRSGRP
jgi:pimeloyl-ACP methyl ester carboxylesterase